VDDDSTTAAAAEPPRAPSAAELRSWVRADLSRNPSWESKLTVLIWRLGNLGQVVGGPGALPIRLVHLVLDTLWTRVVVGSELPATVIPGPGLRLQHAGRGIILNGGVRIGANCSIFHDVTIGTRPPRTGAPVLGDDVRIGVGAILLGPIVLGEGSRAAAGAIVVRDVPPGGVIASPPGRLLDGGAAERGSIDEPGLG
jgi:serine O-acetyltransferase